ncbi:MAG: efflux RND transporter periplasmic adaptor subunit [Candidatus Thiodiazotropha sp.]
MLIPFLLILAVTGAGAVIALSEPVQTVETVRVERGDLELVIRVTGEVINDRRVTLTALVDGQVVSVDAARGDRVIAGQVLASMDNRAAAARQQRAQANLRQVEVLLRQEETRYARARKLSRTGAVSAEQLEQAKLNWKAASAGQEVAQAELQLAQVATEWQQVRAPFDAVVVDKSTESGQWVEAGTKLFSLVALDNWLIEAHVDAVDSSRVSLGQSVDIRCDAFPHRVWHSTLHWIGPSVEREKDNRLNTFRVRLGLGEEAPNLLIGQQVDLEIRVDRREGVLTLPFTALRERDGHYEVGLIDSGRLRYRAVETGLEGDNRVELLSDLAEETQLVSLEVNPPDEGSLVEVETGP